VMNEVRITALENWRKKAASHKNSDRIGHLIARSFELITTVVEDGVNSESVSFLVDSLTQDRTLVMARDMKEPSPPVHAPRELVYGLIESLTVMIKDITEKLTKDIVMQETDSAHLTDCVNSENDHSPLEDFIVKEEEMFGSADDAIGVEGLVDNQKDHDQHEFVSLSQHVKEESKDDQLITSEEVMRAEEMDRQLGGVELVYGVPAEVGTQEQSSQQTSAKHDCSTRSRVFASNKILLNHTTIVHNNIPRNHRKEVKSVKKQDKRMFSCALCSHSFDRPAKLREHVNTHTGERPYKCIVCTTAFHSYNGRKHHLRDVHGIRHQSITNRTLLP
ncbi:hypothetical protein PENTCL1PPCAC_24437, partial [Pristionchus entomophagus]